MDHTSAGLAAWLFAVVCALWAQNTGRNAWLWFFLGLVGHVLTGLVLLYKNSSDRRQVDPTIAGAGGSGTSP
jgi:hypothetical protein